MYKLILTECKYYGFLNHANSLNVSLTQIRYIINSWSHELE